MNQFFHIYSAWLLVAINLRNAIVETASLLQLYAISSQNQLMSRSTTKEQWLDLIPVLNQVI